MVLYVVHMDTRTATRRVVTEVANAIDALGIAPQTIADAADITVPQLNERLAMREDFRLLELLGIGGVLRIHPADLIGAAA